MLHTFSIPASLIQEIMNLYKNKYPTSLDIGKPYIVGDWNNWGDSPEKSGHIRPTTATILNNNYYASVELATGEHFFKVVIVNSERDKNGMYGARWIGCPEEGIGEYTRGKHNNFVVNIPEKPEKKIKSYMPQITSNHVDIQKHTDSFGNPVTSLTTETTRRSRRRCVVIKTYIDNLERKVQEFLDDHPDARSIFATQSITDRSDNPNQSVLYTLIYEE
ncbi:hypothetical protein ISS03_03555 [Patescibacteria group bacterium]|nr:hypothetical protein [Patescibacteria group bacterium]